MTDDDQLQFVPRGRKPIHPVPPDIECLPVSRQRKAQLTRDRLGLCIYCGRPRNHYAKHCDECHESRSTAGDPLKKAHNADFLQLLRTLLPDSVLHVPPGQYRPTDSTIRRMLRDLGYTATTRTDGDQLTIIRFT